MSPERQSSCRLRVPRLTAKLVAPVRVAVLDDIHGVFAPSDGIWRLLEQLPDLRISAQTGNHANHIDLPAAAELGTVIGKATGGGFSIGTAELTIGLMIGVMRRIPQVDAAIRQGTWPTPLGPVLHGKTLGVVGFGRQGPYLARLAVTAAASAHGAGQRGADAAYWLADRPPVRLVRRGGGRCAAGVVGRPPVRAL
jgi:phosphoglycerate dehydrogenase-like enzyme